MQHDEYRMLLAGTSLTTSLFQPHMIQVCQREMTTLIQAFNSTIFGERTTRDRSYYEIIGNIVVLAV